MRGMNAAAAWQLCYNMAWLWFERAGDALREIIGGGGFLTRQYQRKCTIE